MSSKVTSESQQNQGKSITVLGETTTKADVVNRVGSWNRKQALGKN